MICAHAGSFVNRQAEIIFWLERRFHLARLLSHLLLNNTLLFLRFERQPWQGDLSLTFPGLGRSLDKPSSANVPYCHVDISSALVVVFWDDPKNHKLVLTKITSDIWLAFGAHAGGKGGRIKLRGHSISPPGASKLKDVRTYVCGAALVLFSA